MGNKNKISYKNFLKKQQTLSTTSPSQQPAHTFIRTWNVQDWNERRFKEIILQNFNVKRFRVHHEVTFIDQDKGNILFSLKDEERKLHHFVRVRDTSTGNYHLLRIPKEIKSCRQAVAWTFGMSEDEYKLLKEA